MKCSCIRLSSHHMWNSIMAVMKQMSSKPKAPIRLPMLPTGLWTDETHRGSKQHYSALLLWQCQWLSPITKIKCNAWAWNAELLCLVNSKKTSLTVEHMQVLSPGFMSIKGIICTTAVLTPGDLLHEATPAWTRLLIVCKQTMMHGKEKWVLQWLGKQYWLHQCFNSDKSLKPDLECHLQHSAQ